MNFDIATDPHTRIDILTGERILVSPHRSKRPWQGQVEKHATDSRPAYDQDCYLCPGNQRAEGDLNPSYKDSFVFVNDYAALLGAGDKQVPTHDDLFIATPERGICKVVCFSPRHDLTLAEMDVVALAKVVDVWQEEFRELSKKEWIKYIQIFENKGAVMGCSNPHPHGQIWAQSGIPSNIEREGQRQRDYYQTHGQTMLNAYLTAERQKSLRIILENSSFVALVPFWAKWPFETMIISKREVQTILDFTEAEKQDLAEIVGKLTVRYDNLFETSFPYSAGMHQAPVNSGNQEGWHWHMHFYPPLLRSATVKKFMVGYEMLADAQRDITPEVAAERLQQLSDVHYKQKRNE